MGFFNNKKTNISFTNDYVDVKNIEDGVVETSNSFVKILELKPNNFMFKPQEEQEGIIDSYLKFLSITPDFFRIRITNSTYNINGILDNIEEGVKKETDENIRKLAYKQGELIHKVTLETAVKRRFFLIFGYKKRGNMFGGDTTIQQAAQSLSKKEFEIGSFLDNSENNIIVKNNVDYFLAQNIYKYFNPRTYHTQSFSDRVKRIDQDFKYMNGDDYDGGMSPLYFAPKSMKITQKDYYVIDGEYRTHLYIPGFEHAYLYHWFFMSNLISMPQGVDIDIFIERMDFVKFQKKVLSRLKYAKTERGFKGESDIAVDKLDSKIEGARYLRRCLAENQNPYYYGIIFTITKLRYEELKTIKDDIISQFKAISIDIKPFMLQENLISSLAPTNFILGQNEFLKTRRNIMEEDLAKLYPFSAFEMADENGIIIGLNKTNSSLIMIDNFNTSKFDSANMVIVGQAGKGKTFALSLLALRNRIKGRQVFIISPSKAHEFKRSAAAAQGEFIPISTASSTCINPLDLSYQEQDTSIVKEKIARLIPAFSLLLSDMTDMEINYIDSALIKTYRNFGITEDNNSLLKDKNNKEKGLKRRPIISDLYKTLKQDLAKKPESEKRLLGIMQQFETGSMSSFNKETNVKMDNLFTVFDLEKLKGKMLYFGMYVVLDTLWGLVKQDRTKIKTIFVDEGSMLIGAGANKMTAEFIWEMAKIIRAYGGSLVFATQDVNDFFALENGMYGKAILSAAPTKFILGLERQEAELLKGIMTSFTEEEIKQITQYKRGNCLFCTNSDHIPTRIIASDYEHDLITTDREEIKKLKEKGVDI